MAKKIDDRVACRGQQPSLRVLRHAVSWPNRQRFKQSLAQGIFGPSQILGVHRKISHQATIGFAGYPLNGPMNLLSTAFSHSTILRRVSGASGRTSTTPYEAAGQRAAHSRAASSDGTSRIVNPPSCSLVSAYGPSCTLRFPSLSLIVVPVSGTSSGSPPTKTPASTRALW